MLITYFILEFIINFCDEMKKIATSFGFNIEREHQAAVRLKTRFKLMLYIRTHLKHNFRILDSVTAIAIL